MSKSQVRLLLTAPSFQKPGIELGTWMTCPYLPRCPNRTILTLVLFSSGRPLPFIPNPNPLALQGSTYMPPPPEAFPALQPTVTFISSALSTGPHGSLHTHYKQDFYLGIFSIPNAESFHFSFASPLGSSMAGYTASIQQTKELNS